MKKLCVLVVVAVLWGAGCAAHDAKINPMLNGMSQASQAVQAFGPPHRVDQIADGTSLYVWGFSSSHTGGGIPYYQANTQVHTGNIYTPTGAYAGTYTGHSAGGSVAYTPAYQVNRQCELRMIVGHDGRIYTWSYQGNACDALIVNHAALLPDGRNSAGAGQSLRLEECLEAEAIKKASQYGNPAALAQDIEAICQSKTGKIVDNIAMFYAVKALGGESPD